MADFWACGFWKAFEEGEGEVQEAFHADFFSLPYLKIRRSWWDVNSGDSHSRQCQE